MLLVKLNKWSQNKSPWLVLFLSSLALVACALYFQHGLGHAPCVMCIYQRSAMVVIVLSALLPLLMPNSLVRLIAYLGWGAASIWGWLLASEHLSILNSPNPFFTPCPIVPNFPLPLYDWVPSIFGAPGDCLDQSWQFLGLGMPAWMQIIFAIYALTWAFVVMLKLTYRKFKPNH
ncbi:disulfide bond formation protein DsbB [Glaciecola sp. KUL10]|uniref:disulfide bond formation protein DsbB n=1 Tax=Glaciecola sp. (strain KUL10) TaxID=2161813 RepID=UPI000D78650C|nr:disulfide bond formation protein DsbB [Glaciecola sp. KUL10]GBL03435.1 disulfide bond formation protein B [Glaciecola sp. KUL10]